MSSVRLFVIMTFACLYHEGFYCSTVLIVSISTRQKAGLALAIEGHHGTMLMQASSSNWGTRAEVKIVSRVTRVSASLSGENVMIHILNFSRSPLEHGQCPH